MDELLRKIDQAEADKRLLPITKLTNVEWAHIRWLLQERTIVIVIQPAVGWCVVRHP